MSWYTAVLTLRALAGLSQHRPRRSGRREGWRGKSEDWDGGNVTYLHLRFSCAEACSWERGLADCGGLGHKRQFGGHARGMCWSFALVGRESVRWCGLTCYCRLWSGSAVGIGIEDETHKIAMDL